MDTYFGGLENIGPCDGRHILKTSSLKTYFSESALHKYRVFVELKHLIAISKTLSFSLPENVMNVYSSFSVKDAQIISQYDRFGRNGIGPLEHDMKSVEMFLREKLPKEVHHWIHFGLTSEDVNNIAYNCMIRDAVQKVWLPSLVSLCEQLKNLALSYKSVPLLARTHGQPASPTTFGKEMAVFLQRLTHEIKQMQDLKLNAKLNGAVGNYNAFTILPNVDWIAYSQSFVKELGFECELLTNQRGPKNKMIMLFQTVMRANSILKDLNIDLWLYAKNGLLFQKRTESHVGSSVMPHKINPWFVESSEGNCELSNALFELFCRELDISRLQRDLSDSNLERNYGVAFSYSLIALKYTTTFLQKAVFSEENAKKELQKHPEVLSEAYQTILRTEGKSDAYELLKNFFREHKQWSFEDVEMFINGLDVNDTIKQKMKKLTVDGYVGYAAKLVDIAVQHFEVITCTQE